MKLIAETAWHHQGDFEFMKSLIDVICKKSLADIIKLHLTIDLDEYMTRDHPLFNDLGQWLFDKQQWKDIIGKILDNQKKLMFLFNDTQAIDFGMKFQPSHVELHSMCMNDINLLEALRQNLENDTKIVIGVGGTSIYEIEFAINKIQSPNVVLMFGFQNYPTKYESINFRKMRKLMKVFDGYEFGYADHTAWDEPDNLLITLMGAALGMDYIEKHVTTHYGSERVDWASAISIKMANELKNKLDILDACNGNGNLSLNAGEKAYSIYGPMKKTAILKKNVEKGDLLNLDLIQFKRTRQTSDLSQIEAIEACNKKFKRNIKSGTILLKNDLE